MLAYKILVQSPVTAIQNGVIGKLLNAPVWSLTGSELLGAKKGIGQENGGLNVEL